MSQLTQANASSAQAGPTCESGNASSDQAGPTCESGNASSAQAGPVTHRVIKRLAQKLSEAASTSPSSDAGTKAQYRLSQASLCLNVSPHGHVAVDYGSC